MLLWKVVYCIFLRQISAQYLDNFTNASLESQNSFEYVRPPPRWKLQTTFEWKPASETLMWNKFSQRELCTMKPQSNYDSKLSLRQYCQFKPVQNEIRSKLKSLKVKGLTGLADPVTKSNFLKTLPQCDIGFIKYGFWVETSRRQIPQCVVRGTPDRIGYQYSWTGIPFQS